MNQHLAAGIGAALVATTVPAWASGSSANGQGHANNTKTTLSVTESITVAARPGTVWSAVRDFDSPSVWDPAITGTLIVQGKNDKPGAVRRVTTADGASMRQKLVAWNAKKRTFTIRTLATEQPFRRYRERLSVSAEGGDHSRVVWRARFAPAAGTSPAQARQRVSQRMHRALAHLRHMLGVRAAAGPAAKKKPAPASSGA